jgi:hypothetical protein
VINVVNTIPRTVYVIYYKNTKIIKIIGKIC